jgi:hypothetical protein
MALEQRTYTMGLPVQRREGQIRSFCLSVDQISVDPLLGLLECPPEKKFDESRSLASSSIHP